MTAMYLIMTAWSRSERYYLSYKVRNTEHVMHMFELSYIGRSGSQVMEFNLSMN